MFSKIGEVRPKIQANYFKPGHYLVRIDRVLGKKNRKDEDQFIVEMTVIHVYNDMEGKGHKVGEECANVINFKHDMALPNVKRFCMAVLQRPEADITPTVCERIVSDKQPLAGVIVEVQAINTVTKKGNDFTDVGYKRPVPAKHLIEQLTEDEVSMFFPDGLLEKMLEREAK
jgi:hypothetical protein